MKISRNLSRQSLSISSGSPGGGGEELPYVGYTGMCHRPGSIFHFQKFRTGPKF